MDLNLNDETNKQLVQMITEEAIDDVRDEIEAHVFLLVKKLKQEKVTKADDSSSAADSNGIYLNSVLVWNKFYIFEKELQL